MGGSTGYGRVAGEHMNVLVGIDIQPIDEVEDSLRTFGSRYRHLLFTGDELASCGDGPAAAASLAARFAAKEAVLKILDTRETVPPWRSIEVQRTDGGRPEIVLHGVAADIARHQGIQNVSVSLSHAGGIATAAVVAPVERAPEGPNR
jgi:holo-[acyl-carrier protein] synthase